MFVTDNKGVTDSLVSAYINDTMKSKKVTQMDMAKATGHRQSYIYDHLIGKRSWRLDDIEAIATLFGFTSVTAFIAEATGRPIKDR